MFRDSIYLTSVKGPMAGLGAFYYLINPPPHEEDDQCQFDSQLPIHVPSITLKSLWSKGRP